jgi:hypothetical protein
MTQSTKNSAVAGESSVIYTLVCDAEGGSLTSQGGVLTSECNGKPVSGVLVEYSFIKNNSGGNLKNISTRTNASGLATTLYTAGNASPDMEVQDTISAEAAGYVTVAIINRLSTASTGNRIISFTEDPETSPGAPIGPPWYHVTLKVKVTAADDITRPIENETVTFTITDGIGILTNPTLGTTGSPIIAITDTKGEAWILFTRPSTGTNDTVVRAQIFGTTSGGDMSRIVYWTDVP